MENYQMTPKMFGYIFAGLSVGFIGGSQLNILLLRYFSSQKIFRTALVSQFIIGSVYFTGVINHWFDRNLNIAFLFLVLLCIGFTSPNGIALALAPIRKNMGSASALVGMIRIGVAGISSASIGLLSATNSTPVAGMITATAFASLMIIMFGLRRLKRKGVEIVLS
jgi:DHA1 family bicyclomycin/chloramphenicol resistance-like MFS transporter